ncbi:MAG TPA: heterodisulfide reductase-related iron-sulfur binding cluster [Fimbriimonadaceae bacterium]|nr:heterodisulfide reductase-related iron-sulfur binding cluster [Fimbriimonadaceae bacterium]
MEPTRTEFLHLPEWQKTLFYVLVFASLAIGAWQIWLRYREWRKGKPIDWKPPRLKNFLTYVLAQRKVRSSRRRSGAPMHLLIFYGFVSLFLATTLLAIATYAPLIGIPNFHRGTYYLIYEATFDLLGLLFVFGLIWALVRRLAYRPAAVTSNSSDVWMLVLLIVVGVTGYVLEAARIANDPQPFDGASVVGYSMALILPPVSNGAYVAIWWFHMAWVFVFFAVIPRFRLRHIVIACFGAANAPTGRPWGRLEPITMEEVEQTGQIGVAHAKDYSRWHLMSLDACMECGRCTEVCPAHGVGKVLNPKQVVQDIRGIPREDGPTVAEAVSEEALWACTTCNACVEACPVLIRHVDLIVDVRRNLVAEGRLSGTAAVMLRQAASTGSAWGTPASDREDWMKGLDVPLARDKKSFDVLLWVGCAGATDPGAIKTTRAVAELLTSAGIDFACLGNEESCTGDVARRVGDEFLFQEQAQRNVGTFGKYEFKRIVTPCPHCFNTFANEYGQFGGEYQVLHHSRLLADLVAEGRLRAPDLLQGAVTFHDPCYLARINNQSDAPRRALGESSDMDKAIVPTDPDGRLAEPAHFGRKTLCCGAGGGRMFMEEPIEQRPGNRRARELLDTGARTIAVGCPFCRIMLDASLKQVTEEEVRLVDLAEMLQESNRAPADAGQITS